MAKRETIRDLLGFTQEELAMILKVSRSQLSMYEIGRGNLPLSALLLLAEMAQHVKSLEKSNKKSPHIEQQHSQTLQKLERLLKENEYQQMRVDRKIAVIERKFAGKMIALQVLYFLDVHKTKKDEFETSLLKSIGNKASKSLEVEGLAVLTEYQIKQQVLQCERKLLEELLRKF